MGIFRCYRLSVLTYCSARTAQRVLRARHKKKTLPRTIRYDMTRHDLTFISLSDRARTYRALQEESVLQSAPVLELAVSLQVTVKRLRERERERE